MDERTTLRYIDELQGQIDQLKKIIKGGGGGGSVVINPEGAATADLEKIKSGGVIYGLNYNKNANRPQINSNLLTGNKNSKQLNIAESMTEAEYAALSSTNEHEVYFLQENASIVTETEDGFTIEWTAYSDPAYVATLSYVPSDQDVTGITGVTCDTDTIEIVTFVLDHGDVTVTIGCADPSEVPEAVEFTFTFTQPAGSTRIVKNGLEFGASKLIKELYSGVATASSYELSESIANFDMIIVVAGYHQQSPSKDLVITMELPVYLIQESASVVYSLTSDVYYTNFIFTDNTHISKDAENILFIQRVIGVKY